jgi:shikimate kinase
MACFIILRGPMGAGKSEVAKYLAKALEDSFLLDLDLNANCPIQGLNEALGHKNVVAELFHGNSHTTDPNGSR